MEIKYKQFVIVPKQPRMSPGKMASQTAHATFMALERQKAREGGKELIADWIKNGMCVIVLECPTQVELMNINKYCEQWSIDRHLYIDEGITEIPMGTATCFATGVLTEDKFWIFEQLELYTEVSFTGIHKVYDYNYGDRVHVADIKKDLIDGRLYVHNTYKKKWWQRKKRWY